MPLHIVRNDITKMEVDAIVNAANKTLLGGGGVDGAIHHAAGIKLKIECAKLGGCKTGEAKITKGYRLPCKYVIHTVGPIWNGGNYNEEQLLTDCYKNSLMLAKKYNCESVAFPLISSGAYRYPKNQALDVAVNTIGEFLYDNDMTVYIVVFDKNAYKISSKLYDDIASFIDDRYAEYNHNLYGESRVLESPSLNSESLNTQFNQPADFYAADTVSAYPPFKVDSSLNDALNAIDESFSQMLLRKIDEKGITDSQCYKKANIDRKLFSKIRNDKFYKPSKTTVIAFALALELPLDEMENMLMKAGFALSPSSKFDIIIEYFVMHNNYNIYEINEALFAFDQNLIGA